MTIFGGGLVFKSVPDSEAISIDSIARVLGRTALAAEPFQIGSGINVTGLDFLCTVNVQ